MVEGVTAHTYIGVYTLVGVYIYNICIFYNFAFVYSITTTTTNYCFSVFSTLFCFLN